MRTIAYYDCCINTTHVSDNLPVELRKYLNLVLISDSILMFSQFSIVITFAVGIPLGASSWLPSTLVLLAVIGRFLLQHEFLPLARRRRQPLA